ncbi:MAG: signal peptide peptidase SppA [Candidatus Cloacimonetes bacterium]|nr:signal peptide peptidase SppA [Candidatus Cloacimonadota bacterium]
MKRIKFLIALAALLLASVMLFATEPLGEQDFPIAAVDNLFIPYANPSLLGTPFANGVGFVNFADNKKLQDHYWLLLKGGGISYVYERLQDRGRHMFAHGGELFPAHIFPNLYIGTSYALNEGEFLKGSFRSAATYRPHDFSSLAFSWDNPYKARPTYRAGLALRPFAFVDNIDDKRLELSADINYNYLDNAKGDYELSKPILGINTEVLDGVKIGATYNLDKEAALINFSLSGRSLQAGMLYRAKKSDNYGYVWAFASENLYKPLFGIQPKQWYDLPAKGSVVSYKAPKYTLGKIKVFDKKTLGIEELLADIKRAENDPATQGILIQNPAMGMSFALQQELLTGLREFKASGKKVSFYFDNISNGAYILASSIADKIYLNPNGMVDLRGIAISSPYLKDTLESLGIEVLNFRSHKYKNAGNMFSESEMTAAEREVYESLLGDLFDQFCTQIQAGRGERLPKPVAQTIDEGPYFLAQDALEAGLVDEIIYQDELFKKLKSDFGFSRKSKKLPKYMATNWSKPKESLIATVYASGNIVMGKGETGKKIAHESTVKLIRKARKNPMYKGIILRIDSGGGSAQASDIIYRELELAKTENKKPIVVSMAGTAASGGYYIAANADRIIADPATLTGSIGVVGMMFNATELFKKIKVNWGIVKKGENADFLSLNRPMKDVEKQRMERYIEATYDDFVHKVANGRANLSVEDVHKVAQGRVWTGAQAFEVGLVDELGGMQDAVEYMKSLIKGSRNLRMVDMAADESNVNITLSLESSPLFKVLALSELDIVNEEYKELYELWRDYENEPVLMLSPLGNSSLRY